MRGAPEALFKGIPLLLCECKQLKVSCCVDILSIFRNSFRLFKKDSIARNLNAVLRYIANLVN